MQKQQLRNEDVDTGMKRESRRQAGRPTYVSEGRIKADEALCADVQAVVEKMSIWRLVRSFRMTVNSSGSGWFLDFYLINSQT